MNRRAFLSAFAAAGALTVALPFAPGADQAWAQAPARFSRIVVDTKPLEARGGGYSASVMRPHLQAALQRAFAGSLGRGGPTLIVRVRTVVLSSSLPGSGGRFGGGSASDYLEAEVSAGGETFPLLVTQDAAASGAWYSQGYEPRRLRALADALAYWVRRRV